MIILSWVGAAELLTSRAFTLESAWTTRPRGGQEWRDDRNFVPMWDGKPESLSHFVTEVKWTLSSTKKDDRALLAAKIIRKALQSQHGTLVQLMYKLDPEDYKTEASVDNLVKLLEESPLNRQPLPDAGNKIGGYYRRLQRKPHEASFLVREDKVHDDMPGPYSVFCEMTFEGYETTIEELKEFCGMAPEASLYFGPPEGTDAEEDRQEEDEEEDEEFETASRASLFSGTRGTSRTSSRTSGKGKSGKNRAMPYERNE